MRREVRSRKIGGDSFNDVYVVFFDYGVGNDRRLDGTNRNSVLLDPPHYTDEKFLTCLRGLSTAEVLRSIGSLSAPSWPYTDGKHHSIPAAPLFSPIFYFTPAVDGSPHGLEDIPLNLISKGKFNRVPLIAGTNHDEGTIFVPFMLFVIKGFKLPVTDQNVVDTLNHFFDEDDVEPILKMYPVSDFKDNFFRLAFILRDNTFLCSTRRLARAHSGYNAATWVYQFDYAGDWLNGALGDYHTSGAYFLTCLCLCVPLMPCFGPSLAYFDSSPATCSLCPLLFHHIQNCHMSSEMHSLLSFTLPSRPMTKPCLTLSSTTGPTLQETEIPTVATTRQCSTGPTTLPSPSSRWDWNNRQSCTPNWRTKSVTSGTRSLRKLTSASPRG